MSSLKISALSNYPKIGDTFEEQLLRRSLAQFDKKEIDLAQLERVKDEVTRTVLKEQIEAGLEIVTDGQVRWDDPLTYIARKIKGFTVTGMLRYFDTNTFYRQPVCQAELEAPGELVVRDFQYANTMSSVPVKALLTGPYTMMDWSYNESYPDRKSLTLALAEVLRLEIEALVEAGARYIQIDEPATSTRPEELPIVIEGLQICTEGLSPDVKTISHICYGDFAAIYPEMLKIPVDQLDLEMTNSELDMLELFAKTPYTKEIAFGVIDVHSHEIETVDEVKGRLRRALKVIPAEKITVDPDCGLKTRTVEEAIAKLKVMVQAARELREEVTRQRASGSARIPN